MTKIPSALPLISQEVIDFRTQSKVTGAIGSEFLLKLEAVGFLRTISSWDKNMAIAYTEIRFFPPPCRRDAVDSDDKLHYNFGQSNICNNAWSKNCLV